jgi:phospholipid/cholesterol/gamma-HCH transport system substrate-binding protein
MKRPIATLVKFIVFAVVMTILSVALIAVFAETRTGATTDYSAVFTDASRLESGDSVRIAGIRVGTVDEVTLRPDRKVEVTFDADDNIKLTTGTKAVIRYLNLVGDRYMELVDTPDSTKIIPAGAQIPVDRTAPALDLDLLLGGLKPVISALNPQDVNTLTAALIQILQGQGGTLESLLSKSGTFTNSLADNNAVIEQLIVDLHTVLDTLAKDGDEFGGAIDRLESLVKGLAEDRDPIATAIESLDQGTASLASLLGRARPGLGGTVDQVARIAPILDDEKERAELDAQLQRLPHIYRKLARVGSYGAFFPYYICAVTMRASDLQGRTVVFPWIKQDSGRCRDQ